MIWVLFVFFLIVLLIWIEDGSQNCLNKPCHHSLYRFRDPLEDDQLKEKLKRSIGLGRTVVYWRQAIVLALVLAIILTWIFSYHRSKRISGFEFFLVASVIFAGYYFSQEVFSSVKLSQKLRNIDKELSLLENDGRLK